MTNNVDKPCRVNSTNPWFNGMQVKKIFLIGILTAILGIALGPLLVTATATKAVEEQ